MIGSSTLVKMVNGLRPSLSSSRRMIAHVFRMASLPSASRRHRHPEARTEEAALARRLIAQSPAGKTDKDILERHPLQLDRGHRHAQVVDFADDLWHRVRTVVHRYDNRTVGVACDLMNARLPPQHRD